jgi:hypothetical protein
MSAEPSMPSFDLDALRTVLLNTDAAVEGNVDDIIWEIQHGRCPRCEGPLTTKPNEVPAGSRITKCGSIPICGRCGDDEVYEQLDSAQGIGWGLSAASCWPLPVEKIEERRARHQQEQLVTEDPSTPVINPWWNRGGRAQFGAPEEGD